MRKRSRMGDEEPHGKGCGFTILLCACLVLGAGLLCLAAILLHQM